jgi:hypothetical protein
METSLFDNILNPSAVKPSTQDDVFKKVVEEIYSTKNIRMKTDLSPKQIAILTKCIIYAVKFKSKIMQMVIDNFMELCVSKGRASRKEFVDLFRAINGTMNAEMSDRSLLDRLTGRGD